MSTGWTITLVVAIGAAAGIGGFVWGQHRGRRMLARPLTAAVGNRGPTPVIDPNIAIAAKIASSGAKPQKV